MKSLKWEGIGTKYLFPHTSSLDGARPPNVFVCILGINLHAFDCLMTSNFLC